MTWHQVSHDYIYILNVNRLKFYFNRLTNYYFKDILHIFKSFKNKLQKIYTRGNLCFFWMVVPGTNFNIFEGLEKGILDREKPAKKILF